MSNDQYIDVSRPPLGAHKKLSPITSTLKFLFAWFFFFFPEAGWIPGQETFNNFFSHYEDNNKKTPVEHLNMRSVSFKPNKMFIVEINTANSI